MIELYDYEIDIEILRTIDEYLKEHKDNITRQDIYRICHKLVSNLYDAERDKYE